MSAKKAKGKNVEVGTALRAFEATFKAACREHGVPAYKPLVQQLQRCQEECKPCVKVVFAGQSVGGPFISAVCGSLASYTPLNSLSCLGCSIGDEGLLALSSLLKASAGKWWRGCRLATLEICSDGQPPATQQQQQQQQPPLANGPAALGLSRGPSMIPSRPSTAPGRLSSGQANTQQTGGSGAPDKSHTSLLVQGVCPPVPAHLQFASATHTQLAQQALSDRMGPVTRFQSRQSPGLAWQQQLVSSHNAAAEAAAAGHAGWSSSRLVGGAAGGQRCESSCELGSSAWRSSEQQHGEGQCPRFSREVLQDFALALGVSAGPGAGLVRLVLDHTQLGDAGMAVLAAGLGKCCSLKALSCCYCGIATAGAKQLAAALTTVSNAADSSSSSSSSSSLAVGAARPPDDSRPRSASAGAAAARLELQELLMSGNPLNGTGLQQLNAALRTMTSLKLLGLSDIGVTEADKLQLQGLVYALTTGPAALQVLEFDNHIGDRCAAHFLTLLEAKPTLVLLKLTPRAASTTIASAAALMERNLKAAAAHKPAKKKAAKQQ